MNQDTRYTVVIAVLLMLVATLTCAVVWLAVRPGNPAPSAAPATAPAVAIAPQPAAVPVVSNPTAPVAPPPVVRPSYPQAGTKPRPAHAPAPTSPSLPPPTYPGYAQPAPAQPTPARPYSAGPGARPPEWTVQAPAASAPAPVVQAPPSAPVRPAPASLAEVQQYLRWVEYVEGRKRSFAASTAPSSGSTRDMLSLEDPEDPRVAAREEAQHQQTLRYLQSWTVAAERLVQEVLRQKPPVTAELAALDAAYTTALTNERSFDREQLAAYARRDLARMIQLKQSAARVVRRYYILAEKHLVQVCRARNLPQTFHIDPGVDPRQQAPVNPM